MVNLTDFIGLIGVVLVLIAFFLLNAHKLSALNMSYQILNLVGAILILFSLIYSWNLASVIIEVAWIIVSMMGIYRILNRKKPLL